MVCAKVWEHLYIGQGVILQLSVLRVQKYFAALHSSYNASALLILKQTLTSWYQDEYSNNMHSAEVLDAEEMRYI